MTTTPITKSEQFEALWKVQDVMTYLKASRSWVYQRAEDGTLPSLRIFGLLRFEPSVVRAWALSPHRVPPRT